MIKQILTPVLYVLAVVIPAGLMIAFLHFVVEMRDGAMAEAATMESAQEIKIDLTTGLPIDPETDLIMGPGYNVIKKNCVRCHPTSLIYTFRTDRAGWLDAIRWMQAEKGLQVFSEKTETTILDYLTTYYGP